MAKARKKETRRNFRDAVFGRDGYRCVVCGLKSSPDGAEEEIDAHHVTPREEMPNGGYVKENGVTLCDPAKRGGDAQEGCHWKAEFVLQHREHEPGFPSDDNPFWPFAPEQLYVKIGSSRERAIEASEKL